MYAKFMNLGDTTHFMRLWILIEIIIDSKTSFVKIALRRFEMGNYTLNRISIRLRANLKKNVDLSGFVSCFYQIILKTSEKKFPNTYLGTFFMLK